MNYIYILRRAQPQRFGIASKQDRYEQIEKQKEGINLENTNKKDILDYLNTRLFQYKEEKLTNKDLQELYKGDFINFNINTFRLLD